MDAVLVANLTTHERSNKAVFAFDIECCKNRAETTDERLFYALIIRPAGQCIETISSSANDRNY